MKKKIRFRRFKIRENMWWTRYRSQASVGSLQSQSAVTLDPRKLQATCKLSPKKFIENNAELEKRLEKLANATSAETILTDSKNLNKISIDVKGKISSASA